MIAGVEVTVQKRPGESTYDVMVPTEVWVSGGYTITLFPDHRLSDDDVARQVTADIEATLSELPSDDDEGPGSR
ncbi:hypothetical protein Cde04nite_32840 [Cellulomonas denverensis]|nr:hypothetical protein Cde04nite_32840 [Cellulomonas denverensis]